MLSNGLRGPKNSKVTITIMREGFSKPQEFSLVRDVIPMRSVRSELMDKPTVISDFPSSRRRRTGI